jgi:predicted transcriptional regulator of viral defense system
MRFEKAKRVFRRHAGVMRTSEAIRLGVHPRTLYAMRDAGDLERLSRGLYRLAEMPPLGNPDLTTVALRVPKGVICLISALAFHDLTTQIPHYIYLALLKGTEAPRVDYPPLRLFWFSPKPFVEGVETHQVDSAPVRVYNVEKTLADCFKFRNKIGLDVALEAIRLYFERKPVKVDELMRYAAICRVRKVMRPYIEALL